MTTNSFYYNAIILLFGLIHFGTFFILITYYLFLKIDFIDNELSEDC